MAQVKNTSNFQTRNAELFIAQPQVWDKNLKDNCNHDNLSVIMISIMKAIIKNQ